MKKVKLCKLCHERPAEVPDRDEPGRPVKSICRECHAERLRGDLGGILNQRRYSADR